jgi:hypothetical protein
MAAGFAGRAPRHPCPGQRRQIALPRGPDHDLLHPRAVLVALRDQQAQPVGEDLDRVVERKRDGGGVVVGERGRRDVPPLPALPELQAAGANRVGLAIARVQVHASQLAGRGELDLQPGRTGGGHADPARGVADHAVDGQPGVILLVHRTGLRGDRLQRGGRGVRAQRGHEQGCDHEHAKGGRHSCRPMTVRGGRRLDNRPSFSQGGRSAAPPKTLAWTVMAESPIQRRRFPHPTASPRSRSARSAR